MLSNSYSCGISAHSRCWQLVKALTLYKCARTRPKVGELGFLVYCTNNGPLSRSYLAWPTFFPHKLTLSKEGPLHVAIETVEESGASDTERKCARIKLVKRQIRQLKIFTLCVILSHDAAWLPQDCLTEFPDI